MLELDGFEVASLKVLANATPAQCVPTVIARHLVEPGGERPRGIVGAELLSHLHENLRGSVLCVLAGRQHPPAKAEDGRGVLPIELAPGVDISGPDLGQQLRQFRFAHHSDRVLSVHQLIRLEGWEYFTTITE